jgi:IclR family transcriptional regulator, pca regulon regulatory protein
MNEPILKPGDRDYVGALAAGLEVLQAFDAEHRRMTLSEVAARAAMDRAKARRFLLTLLSLGFVKRNGRQFELTPRVLQLGYAYQASNQYRAVIQQYLEEITAELGESSSLAVLDGGDVIYVVRSAARHRLMAITLSVGTRLPAAYTSMGRVLLGQLPDPELDAFMERVQLEPFTPSSVILKARAQGYSVVDQELDLALRSVAVPVFAGSGELLGAINISTNAARVDMDTLVGTYLPHLQSVAEKVRQTTR